jgi:hypothetical protein
MIETTLLSPTDAGWTNFLASAEHDVYHLPGYLSAEADRLGGEAVAVLVEGVGQKVFLPLVLRPLPWGVAGRDATSPYGYPGPLVAGDADLEGSFVRDAGTAIADTLREMGCASAFIRCHPLLRRPEKLFSHVGIRREVGPTVWIDLETPASQRWSEMNPKRRGVIRRTYRDGAEAMVDPEWEHLGEFLDIYTETMDRVGASQWYYFAESYFTYLRAALGDRLHLIVARRGGEVVGAGLFTTVGGIAQYHLSGSKIIRGKSASAVVIHYASTWAEERGLRLLHLGGGVGGASDDLFRFKAGFSNLRGSFAVWNLVPDRAAFDRACAHAPPSTEGRSDGGSYFPPYRRD